MLWVVTEWARRSGNLGPREANRRGSGHVATSCGAAVCLGPLVTAVFSGRIDESPLAPSLQREPMRVERLSRSRSLPMMPDGSSNSEQRAEQRESEAPESRPCVLVVEDNVDSRELLEEHFSRAGFRVLSAATAREALGVLEANKDCVDVLVTDYMLEHANETGTWLIESASKAGLLERCHARILCSAYAGAKRALKDNAEAVRVFMKPIDFRQLRSAIDEALGAKSSFA